MWRGQWNTVDCQSRSLSSYAQPALVLGQQIVEPLAINPVLDLLRPDKDGEPDPGENARLVLVESGVDERLHENPFTYSRIVQTVQSFTRVSKVRIRERTAHRHQSTDSEPAISEPDSFRRLFAKDPL